MYFPRVESQGLAQWMYAKLQRLVNTFLIVLIKLTYSFILHGNHKISGVNYFDTFILCYLSNMLMWYLIYMPMLHYANWKLIYVYNYVHVQLYLVNVCYDRYLTRFSIMVNQSQFSLIFL